MTPNMLTPDIFAVGLIIAAVAPTIGLFFVVRRFSTIADTLAHVSLAGVAIALISGVAAIPAALAVSLASVLGIEHLRTKKTLPPDAIVSLFLFGGLALGIVLLGFTHYQEEDVDNYLFGNIATVSPSDMVVISVIGAVAFAVTLILWRQLFTVAVDEETAEAAGLPVRSLNRLLSVLGAATIAISMNVAGVLLIGALMVIPVLSAMQFRRSFAGTWRLSVIFSLLSVLLGLTVSYYGNLASGGAIVLTSIICFLFCSLFAKA